MAYNYRPKTEKDIKDLKLPTNKEKTVLELFNNMKASFGKNYDEFITIETGDSNRGNVKVLNDFKTMIDIKMYAKMFPGLALKFGNGSNPSSNSPTTQQQELVTLAIFEELLSSKTKNYTNFEQMIGQLSNIYPGLVESKSWYKSFELQFNEIRKVTKLPNNTFDVYNRDGGFMDYVTKLVNSKFNIAKKDSWNPADIWLLRSTTKSKYEDALDDAVSVQECNAILAEAYKKMDIVGVSLKKNDGRNLNYELVNLESKDKDLEVKFEKFDLNIPYDKNKRMFTSVTSKVNVKYQGKTYSMGVKSNQADIANITYEFQGAGSAAFLGKVPKDMLKIELAKDGQKLPEAKDFMKFDRRDFEMKIRKIQQQSNMFNIKGDIKSFVDNLEDSWSKGRSKDNVIISQIVTFAYIMADMPVTRRKEFTKDLFFMSQKKGKLFGPFGKLF